MNKLLSSLSSNQLGRVHLEKIYSLYDHRPFVFVDWQLSESCIKSQKRRCNFVKDLILDVAKASVHMMKLVLDDVNRS